MVSFLGFQLPLWEFTLEEDIQGDVILVFLSTPDDGMLTEKSSKLCITGHLCGESTNGFPTQMASNAKNISMSWLHQDKNIPISPLSKLPGEVLRHLLRLTGKSFRFFSLIFPAPETQSTNSLGVYQPNFCKILCHIFMTNYGSYKNENGSYICTWHNNWVVVTCSNLWADCVFRIKVWTKNWQDFNNELVNCL